MKSSTLTNALSLVTDREIYTDKLQIVLYQEPTTDQIAELRSVNRRKSVNLHSQHWHRSPFISVTTPSADALHYISAELQPAWVNYIEIALNLITTNRDDARLVQSYVETRLTEPWRGREPQTHRVNGTRYTGTRKQKRRLAGYADKDSKLSRRPCYHLELRVTGREKCNRIGIPDIPSLIHADLAAILRRWVRLQTVDWRRLIPHIQNRLDRLHGDPELYAQVLTALIHRRSGIRWRA